MWFAVCSTAPPPQRHVGGWAALHTILWLIVRMTRGGRMKASIDSVAPARSICWHSDSNRCDRIKFLKLWIELPCTYMQWVHRGI